MRRISSDVMEAATKASDTALADKFAQTRHREIAEALAEALGGQKALAKEIGVSQPTIHAWIRKKDGEIKGTNLIKLYQVAQQRGIIDDSAVGPSQIATERIAHAIMDERERCAKIVVSFEHIDGHDKAELAAQILRGKP